MGTLRNAVKRKIYRERPQPSSRRKYGFLERHRDYVQRARNFNKKRDYIKKLQLKASLRNPDEFYFGMHGAAVKEGKHQVSDPTSLDNDTVLLLKTQDLTYVNMERAKDMKKVEKLSASLHLLGTKPLNKHTVFVETEKEKKNFDPSKHLDTVPELMDRTFNRPKISTLSSRSIIGFNQMTDVKRNRRKNKKAYEEVKERSKRAEKLKIAADHLYTKRAVMKSKKKAVKKVKEASGKLPAVFKWKRERYK